MQLWCQCSCTSNWQIWQLSVAAVYPQCRRCDSLGKHCETKTGSWQFSCKTFSLDVFFISLYHCFHHGYRSSFVSNLLFHCDKNRVCICYPAWQKLTPVSNQSKMTLFFSLTPNLLTEACFSGGFPVHSTSSC